MAMTTKTDIINLSLEGLADWLAGHRQKPFHAKQIFKWIYQKQADGFEKMTDLGKELRTLLSNQFFIGRLEKCKIDESVDGSKKYLFRLEDKEHIETVLIPEEGHYTLCISSQVGCAQGCRFCMTAKAGFVRNLSRAEIISQIRDVETDLPDKMLLTNIVIMGMGEPLANYDNVHSALETIIDGDFGMKYSSRRVTLSTVGLVPGLKKMGKESPINLAVSLNAADNKTREMLMPVNRKYPIEKLLEACRNYPLKSRRRITFEYILIRGVNDSPRDAERLAGLLKSVKAKVNLIPFNEHEGCDFKRPETSAILKFQDILIKRNFTTMIRHSKGRDISAACGQLRANYQKKK